MKKTFFEPDFRTTILQPLRRTLVLYTNIQQKNYQIYLSGTAFTAFFKHVLNEARCAVPLYFSDKPIVLTFGSEETYKKMSLALKVQVSDTTMTP